jgi:hypothetical protein
MAYKRNSKKTGPNTRKTTTISTKGPNTISNSMKSGNVTYTTTTKGGKSYTTQTIRGAGGFVERKRIGSNSPRKKNSAQEPSAALIIFIIVCGAIAYLFGV